MATKYNPYSEIKSVYDAKIGYGNAKTDEERKKYQDAANKARQTLIDNDYGYIADQISSSGADANATKKIMDQWSKYGKTPTRDYYYSMGKKYGLSQSDIDSKIGWDNDTKELSYGGVKVGTPDAIVDGVGYWSEENLGKLAKSFEDDIARTGTSIPQQQLMDQNNTGVKQKIDDYWGTIKGDRDKYYSEYDKVSDYVNRDVTKTDEYQSTYKNIMGKYDMSAMQGRNNAIASGGASNGGNIDSYAAANAMRQQMAITAQGQALAHQLGLDTYNARVNNARQLLSGLGVYQKDSWAEMRNGIGLQQDESQRLFENSETAKNNEVARLVEQSKVTGYTPQKWTYDNNIYLNSDGTVRSAFLTDEFDATGGFETMINDTKAKIATTTDPAEKANLQATLDQLYQAKTLKTFSDPKYAKWAHQVKAVTPQRTADYDTTLKQIDASVDIAKGEAEAAQAAAEAEANAKLGAAQLGYMGDVYKADSDYAGTVYKADKDTEAKTKEEEKKQKEKDEKEIKEIKEDDVTGWVNYFNNLAIERGYEGEMLVPDGKNKYKLAKPSYFETVALHILSSTDLTINQKMYILKEKFGLTDDQINMVKNDKHYSE